MSKQDDLMYELLRAKGNKEKIFFAPLGQEPTTPVDDEHQWDLNHNVYYIRRRREFIVQIMDRDKKNPIIHSTENHWTRSDFGNTEMCEYVLMREVYPEEMK